MSQPQTWWKDENAPENFLIIERASRLTNSGNVSLGLFTKSFYSWKNLSVTYARHLVITLFLLVFGDSSQSTPQRTGPLLDWLCLGTLHSRHYTLWKLRCTKNISSYLENMFQALGEARNTPNLIPDETWLSFLKLM